MKERKNENAPIEEFPTVNLPHVDAPIGDPPVPNRAHTEMRLDAGIDVLTLEPMRGDCILKNAKNITITPHIAWAPIETRERLLGIVMDNIECFLNGTPKHIVN